MNATTSSAGAEGLAAAPSGRHKLVLDEAAKQLNSRGVLLTSLAEIAAKLGVSRSAMYYYVEDRDDLVFQCYRRAADVLKNFITHMLDPSVPEIAARAEIAMMSASQRDTIQRIRSRRRSRSQARSAGPRGIAPVQPQGHRFDLAG